MLPAWYSSKWQKNDIFKKFSKEKYDSLAIISLQILKDYNFLDLSTKSGLISKDHANLGWYIKISKSCFLLDILQNDKKMLFLKNSQRESMNH